jgi:hypothetical protein
VVLTERMNQLRQVDLLDNGGLLLAEWTELVATLDAALQEEVPKMVKRSEHPAKPRTAGRIRRSLSFFQKRPATSADPSSTKRRERSLTAYVSPRKAGDLAIVHSGRFVRTHQPDSANMLHVALAPPAARQVVRSLVVLSERPGRCGRPGTAYPAQYPSLPVSVAIGRRNVSTPGQAWYEHSGDGQLWLATTVALNKRW